MESKKEDLRIRRTFKLLSDALSSLMKEKPFEKITVIDICERAMVHRTTFYTHFKDKFDLLRYNFSKIEEVFEREKIEHISAESYKNYYLRVAKNIFNMLSNDKEFYSHIFKKNKTDSLMTNFKDIISEKVRTTLETFPDRESLPAPIDILSSFYAGACLSVAYWWIENDMRVSVDQLVNYIDKLIVV